VREREADRCIEAPSGQAGKAPALSASTELSPRSVHPLSRCIWPAAAARDATGFSSGKGTWWRAVAHRPPGRAQRVAGSGAPRECSNDDGGGGGA